MDPITGSIIASVAPSILGGLFGGGGGPDMSAQNALYGMMKDIWGEMMTNYKSANLEQADAAQEARYEKNVNEVAGNLLEKYDANRTAGHQYGMDSEATRARAMIADQAAKDVANMKANNDASRLSRYNSLLPNTNQMAGGAGLAGNIDAASQMGTNSNNALMAQLANLAYGMIPKSGGSSSSSSSLAAQTPAQALGYQPPAASPTFNYPTFDFSY